jgi:signal transduction histidine kinase
MRFPSGKLKNKIALINTLSKVLIIGIAVFMIPWLVNQVSIKEIDSQLISKLDTLYSLIENYGVDQFINDGAGSQAYGSYNILKEEYISIERIDTTDLYESIDYSKRNIEGEVMDYRVISATFETQGNYYLIEIGKSITSILNFQDHIRKFTLFFLIALLGITFLIDLLVTQYLLRPFGRIIEKLKRSDHPKNFDYTPVPTNTTDFRYLEENIHSLMHKIERAFNDEREYISNISHELLTPISIIRTKLDNFVNSTSLTDEEMVKIIESKVTLGRLTRLVRTLLLMSRIENEEYLLNEEVDINELLQEIGADFKEHFEQKELDFRLEASGVPVKVRGNRELLHILFFNLVNNAIKYTSQGGRITVTQTQRNEISVVEVADNGIGIAEENLPYIFSRFKKFQESENNFGLGLALVKKIADYHHYRIEAYSKPGQGTRFVIIMDLHGYRKIES